MAKEPKLSTSIRLSRGGLEYLDKLAAQHHVDRSDVIRAAIVVATRPKHQTELDNLIITNRDA